MKQLLIAFGFIGISCIALLGCNSGTAGNSSMTIVNEGDLSQDRIELIYRGNSQFHYADGVITDIAISSDHKLYAAVRNYIDAIKKTDILIYEYKINDDGSLQQEKKQSIALIENKFVNSIAIAWSKNNYLYVTIGDSNDKFANNISYWAPATNSVDQLLIYKGDVSDHGYKTGIAIYDNYVYSSSPSGYNWYNASYNGSLTFGGHISSDSDTPTSITISPNGQYAYTTVDNSGAFHSGETGYINRFKVNSENGSLVFQKSMSSDSDIPRGIAISPDGKYAYIATDNRGTFKSGRNGYLGWYNINSDGSLTYQKHLGDDDAQLRVTVSHDGKYVYTLTSGGYINWYKVLKDE